MLLTNNLVFLGFGAAVCTFMYGTFGYASYFIIAALAYLGEVLVFEKRLKLNLRCTLVVAATTLMLFMLFHSVTTAKYDMASYGGYLSQCYFNASKGYSGYSFGGVICGLLVYPVAKGTTFIGAYVIFSILTLALGVLSFFSIRSVVLGKLVASKRVKKPEESAEQPANGEEAENVAPSTEAPKPDNLYSVNENHEIVTRARGGETSRKPEPAQSEQERQPSSSGDDRFSPENLGRRILFQNGEFAAESYRRNMIYNEDSYFNHPVQNDDDYLRSFSSGARPQEGAQNGGGMSSASTSYTEDYSSGVDSTDGGTATPSYVYGDEPVSNLGEHPLYSEHNEESDYDSYTVNGSPIDDGEEERTPPVSEERGEESPAVDEPPRNDPYGLQTDEPAEETNGVNEQPPTMQESAEEQPPQRQSPEEPAPEENGSRRGNRLFDLFSADNPRLSSERRIEPDVSALQTGRRERSRENLFDDSDDEGLFGDRQPLVPRTQPPAGSRSEEGETSSPARPSAPATVPTRNTSVTPQPERAVSRTEDEKPPVEEKPKHVWKKYVRPTLDLLDDYPENTNVNTAEIEESKQIICETLADYRIDSRIANVVVGPAITRYDVVIEDRTNIKNALKYREAIAMALMKENVTAYLNYSKGAISIEVPNSSRSVVGLKSMLASSAFLNAKPNSLTFTLGKNVEGQVVCPDITKMPHLLVAGTTGSGKSICLSTLIVSLLYKYGPEELRFILVDPKQVEFISYDKLPHLMINEIIYDVDKAIKALNWAIKEMENRYQLFKEMTEKGVATKNLTEYNAHLPAGEEKLPKIVIILDEFGDLMLQAKKDIESRIIRLVQKARACGIHLILATQRPSVDCITGLIKSNLPTRIGFKVNSFDDARCIFDIGGAEKLLGKGDLYFRSAENPELARIQGCFIDTHEVQRVTDFIKQNNETYFDQSVSDFINTVEEEVTETPSDDGLAGDSSKVDDTFIKALKFCVTSNQASVSMIQRRFPIGYMKACKIIDWMENMNYITQSEGSKPRKVLLSREEFIQRYGDVDD